jgi:carbohydrate-selective porin OprB
LAGYVNGDVLAGLPVSQDGYLARYFVRWYIHAGRGFTKLDPSVNSGGGEVPAHRIVVTAGKVSVTDLFDLNSYAVNARAQFFNWTIDTNGAYDYAGDVRGYTHGVALEWVNPDWALRAGTFQMPTTAGGVTLSGDLLRNHGDQLEAEFHPAVLGPKSTPMTVRVLAFHNQADMGDYEAALDRGRRTGSTPNIALTRQEGAQKYGFGLNLERPLADKAATGVFLRLGWNEGRKEDFAFTEADRSVSLGGQLAGVHWKREADRVGLAFCENGISQAHADYLAAGGTGFMLGDGRLSYAPEQIAELYYNYQVNKNLSVTGDYQFLSNPGYNRDRGPLSVLGVRVHLKF